MNPIPTRIKLAAEGGIAIEWNDGHSSLYPHPYLRRKCPCASCGDKDQESTTAELDLPILGQEQVKALGANAIGHYAIQFAWNDGHDAGLYTFDYLRDVCPCEQCRKAHR